MELGTCRDAGGAIPARRQPAQATRGAKLAAACWSRIRTRHRSRSASTVGLTEAIADPRRRAEPVTCSRRPAPRPPPSGSPIAKAWSSCSSRGGSRGSRAAAQAEVIHCWPRLPFGRRRPAAANARTWSDRDDVRQAATDAQALSRAAAVDIGATTPSWSGRRAEAQSRAEAAATRIRCDRRGQEEIDGPRRTLITSAVPLGRPATTLRALSRVLPMPGPHQGRQAEAGYVDRARARRRGRRRRGGCRDQAGPRRRSGSQPRRRRGIWRPRQAGAATRRGAIPRRGRRRPGCREEARDDGQASSRAARQAATDAQALSRAAAAARIKAAKLKRLRDRAQQRRAAVLEGGDLSDRSRTRPCVETFGSAGASGARPSATQSASMEDRARTG